MQPAILPAKLSRSTAACSWIDRLGARMSPSALSAKREIIMLPDSKSFAAAAAVLTRTSALPAQRETTRLALALPSENDSWRAFGFFHKILSLLLLLIISTSI